LRARALLGGNLDRRLGSGLFMELLARNGAHFSTSSTLKTPNGICFANVDGSVPVLFDRGSGAPNRVGVTS
jgi:hypothetical protein